MPLPLLFMPYLPTSSHLKIIPQDGFVPPDYSLSDSSELYKLERERSRGNISRDEFLKKKASLLEIHVNKVNKELEEYEKKVFEGTIQPDFSYLEWKESSLKKDNIEGNLSDKDFNKHMEFVNQHKQALICKYTIADSPDVLEKLIEINLDNIMIGQNLKNMHSTSGSLLNLAPFIIGNFPPYGHFGHQQDLFSFVRNKTRNKIIHQYFVIEDGTQIILTNKPDSKIKQKPQEKQSIKYSRNENRNTHSQKKEHVSQNKKQKILDDRLSVLLEEANNGNIESQWCLYKYSILISGKNKITLPEKDSIHWLQEAANNGHKDSKLELAKNLIYGRFVDCDKKKAYLLLKSEIYYAPCRYLLGVCYFYGWGVNKNIKAAEYILKNFDKDEISDYKIEGTTYTLNNFLKNINPLFSNK